jgi:hypothetical protein
MASDEAEILVEVEEVGKLVIELNFARNPETVKAILDALPVESRVNRWGDEIYFTIPVEVGPENTTSKVEVGDVAYWPPGKALCIFFGPTPISEDDRPKPASPVNVVGKVGDATVLRKVKDGATVTVFQG